MLQQMAQRLREKRTFEAAVTVVLDDVVALHGAEYGNIQLPHENELVIVVQRGLSERFLNAFRRVTRDDGSACGRALLSGKPVVIPDVRRDEAYAAFREDAAAAGYRAVQSTPIFAEKGGLIAVVSTLFANPHEPTTIEMKTLEEYTGIAAAYLQKLLAGRSLSAIALEMSRALYADIPALPSQASPVLGA